MAQSLIKKIFSSLGKIFSSGKPKERRARKRFPPRKNTTILIVDDSRTMVYMLKSMLEPAGYNTLEAGSGEQAIEMAKLHCPSLILMDVVMPGMNGFQATRMLRKDSVTANIPIIIISATEQPTEEIWSKRLGANGFMSKPIARGMLFGKLEQILLHA